MPTVEEDLKIGHDEAGSFFFLITLGYCTGLFLSGFFSSRFKHRRAIIFSSFAGGGALFLISAIHNLWGVRFGLVVMGLAAGFYLPSGISTLTSLVNQRHWGKAIALHEMAPNVGFIVAPVLAEVLLGWCSWRGILITVGVASWIAGLIFILWGKGGDFLGAAPDLKTLKNILREPSFLLMVAFFSLGVGSSFAIYSMIPLYLVSEKGMDRTWANTLLAISRIAPVVTAFIAGWMTDRLGAKKTLKVVFLTAGLATVMIGIAPVAGDQNFELAAGRMYLVGRAVTSDISIFDPTISRKHAELHVTPAGVTIKDLGSSNGTLVNGTRITEGRARPGDAVTFGKVLFQLEATETPTSRAQGPAGPAAMPGGTIVRQVAISGGIPAVLAGETALELAKGDAAGGQLKVAAASAQERIARKLSLLLDVSQKLSGELDLDKLHLGSADLHQAHPGTGGRGQRHVLLTITGAAAHGPSVAGPP